MIKKFVFLFFLVLLLSGCGDGRQRITLVNNNDTNNTVIKQDYAESITPPAAPLKKGFIFIGWYKDKDLTEKFDFNNMPKKNVTLYAKWEPFPYNIIYHLDGGYNSNLNPRMYTTLISVELNNPTKIDYNFLGWYDNKDFTGEPITSIPKGSIGPINLYAKWEKILYKVAFNCIVTTDLPIVEGEINSQITLPTPEKLEYTFLGWRLDDTVYPIGAKYSITGNVTLTAIWEAYSNGLLFKIDKGETTIKSYNGSATVFVIPDAIMGCPVVSIEAQAFKGNKTIKTMKTGDHITHIGNEAFNSMEKLESINFSNEATKLGSALLKGCNSLKSITISSKANYNFEYYFGNAPSNIPETLKTVKLASGANPINTRLLKSNFKNITLILPDDTIEIAEEQFKDVALKSLIIPKSVRRIGKNAFLNATSLLIYTEASVKPWGWSSIWNPDNRPVVWGYTKTIIRGDVEYALTSKDSAYVIRQAAASIATDITILPKVDNCVVTEIMPFAFNDNQVITNITIPPSIKHIREKSFQNATNLIKVNFVGTSNLLSIGEKAFYQCRKLSSIIIPVTVNEIGPNAFRGASILTIFVKNDSQAETWDLQWNSDDITVIWNYKKTVILNSIEYILTSNNEAYVLGQEANSNVTDITILNVIEGCQVFEIIHSAFCDNSVISTIIIPASIQVIGEYAFSNTKNLKTVIFEENSQLDILENYVFYGASALENIEMPKNITSINKYAFARTNNLQSIIIPASVQVIGDYAFSFSGLNEINFEANSNLDTIKQSAFWKATNLETITLPAGLTTIEIYAFNFESLTSIFIPESVKTVGAFIVNASFHNITVYAEATHKPVGWSSFWYQGKPTIIWGYTE
ncbi:MAG: leucine-rich repeat protein [Bacilli bacterium]